MIFHSYSQLVDRALARFNHFLGEESVSDLVVLRQKAALCDCEVVPIACDDPIAGRLGAGAYTPQTIVTLFEAWRAARGAADDLAHQEKWWDVIRQVGENTHANVLWRFHEPAGNRFFLLLGGHETQGLPPYEILFLCNLWQIEREYLPVHAAGVIRRGGLYLFTGLSGAGKSTAAAVSREVGGCVLDEDQVLVHVLDDGTCTADAWGYDVKPGDVPLRAIFTLLQASEDCLIPLSRPQVARILVERHTDVMGTTLTDDVLLRSFRLPAATARRIPGYMLHFRKSPAFWRLIDEQFPG